jgi:cytochrome c peroxidase
MTDGQFQVVTTRDVALTPPQCPTTEAGQFDANGAPVPYFQKEFFHNGYIKSLKQLVHFYNTRDFASAPGAGAVTYAFPVTSGHCPMGTVERVTCWPQPEVPNNIDMTTGALGLTDTEENQVVAFLQTLNDGFITPYKNIDTFTGQCSTTLPGQTASTQGNETIIPTWDLATFPCATDICGVAPLPSPNPIP